MRIWSIRADAPSVVADLRRGVVSITSKRRPQISEGDTLVLTKGAGRHLIFSAHSAVEGVSKTETTDHDNRYQITIKTGEWTAFAEDLSLNALRYSLTLVRNLQYPDRHFRGSYRKVPEEDFGTLVSGEIFVARTAFHELLAALPEQLRRTFLADEILFADSERRFSLEGRFVGRLRRLYDFILFRVVSVGVLLQELSDVIGQVDLRDDRGAELAHAFADEDQEGISVAPDNIADQAALFSELLGNTPVVGESRSQVAAIEAVLQSIGSRDGLPRERTFERLFASAA
jgi:hypothetical protein